MLAFSLTVVTKALHAGNSIWFVKVITRAGSAEDKPSGLQTD